MEESTRTRRAQLRRNTKSDKGPAIPECDKEAVIWLVEETEESRKVIDSMSEGSDLEMEQTLLNYRMAGREVLGWDHPFPIREGWNGTEERALSLRFQPGHCKIHCRKLSNGTRVNLKTSYLGRHSPRMSRISQ